MRKVYRDNELVAAMRELGWVSLKRLAGASGVPYYQIMNAAKIAGAVAGKPYEERHDWAKVEGLVRSYLDADKGLPTVRAVIEKAVAGKKKAQPDVYEFIEGKRVAKRKHAHCEIGHAENCHHPKKIPVVLLKDDKKVYALMAQTRTNTVLRSVDAEGNFNSEFVRNLSNRYLNDKALPREAMSLEEVLGRYSDADGGAER